MREVPSQGPKPGPILPSPRIAPMLDAGLAPAPQGASSNPARLMIPTAMSGSQDSLAINSPAPDVGVAMSRAPESDPPPPTQPPQQQQPAPPVDAGVDSAADLPPEAPDAGPIVQSDAGQPLRR
jgi:hypothetical protein